ncbi:MAG: hypothetical protein ABW000_07235 [Actinoplanes sp.]
MIHTARRTALCPLTGIPTVRPPRGGWHREDPSTGGDGGTPGHNNGGGQSGGNTGNRQQGGQASGPTGGGQGDAQTVEQLPGWAQRVISDLRRENAAKRTGGQAGGNDQGQQSGQSSGQQPQGTNQAGKSDEDIQAAQATARDSVAQLSAFRAASRNGADPDALLDSLAFVEKLKTLDPAAEDFTTKLSAAIKKAVEDNPKLKAVQAAGRSAGEFTGRPGGSADKEPTTPGDRLRRGYAANQT